MEGIDWDWSSVIFFHVSKMSIREKNLERCLVQAFTLVQNGQANV